MGQTSIIIPDGVTEIKDWAFYSCTRLTSVIIPNSVTSIGEAAFQNCKSLTSLYIPDSVTTINELAFSGCTSLTSVIISQGVVSIGDQAFSGCIKLASIAIPNSVTSIGSEICDDAFSEAGERISCLRHIYSYALCPPNIKEDTFGNNNLSYITLCVPAESLDIYRNTDKKKA